MTSFLPATIALPSAAGSLESYIQAVNRFPLLSEEEELRLARQYRDKEDLEAAGQLVLSHLRLVVSIARGYLGYGLPHGDLIQEGNVGLMKAVKRFDPDRGVRLVSFAVHWIRAEMHEYILRNWRIVKIATTKAQRKLFFNLRSMKTGHGALSAQETGDMASQLRVKPSDVSEMETRLSRPGPGAGAGRRGRGRQPTVRSRTCRIPRTSRAAFSSTRKAIACAAKAWSGRSKASIRAAAGSSRRAGCASRIRSRCMTWPRSSAYPPSASARSKRRR